MPSKADNDPQDISKILESLKNSTDLGRQIEIAEIWDQWPQIVGKELAEYVSPVGFKDGTLTLEAKNAVWMHKISYIKSEIIQKMNEKASLHTVSDIFLTLESEDAP